MKELLQRALGIFEVVYGPSHAQVATNNLAEFGRDLTANATLTTSSTSECYH
jgi:hypothetical protein